MSAVTPRTSIVMPVYNTAEYLIEAIESVLAQSDTDWELLIINDCSPDNAAQVVQQFLTQHQDSRIRYLEHQHNQGLSAARNTALQHARGEWIAFLDSDDTFEPDFLSRLHSLAATTGAEIVAGSHTLVSIDGSTQQRLWPMPEQASGEQAAVALLQDQITPYVWDKLFRAEILRQLSFDDRIRRAEDALYTFEACALAAKFAATKAPVYRYRVDPNSLTWGNLVEVTESDKLVEAFADVAAQRLQRSSTLHSALAAARLLTYVNNAHQALVNSANESAKRILRGCRERLTLRDIVMVARIKPALAAAAALLKALPGVYRAVYLRYINKQYGIAA